MKDANEDTNWRKILGKSYLDKHQKDIELLLRVFSLVGAADKYKNPMKEFLNQEMRKHNSGTSEKATGFFRVFGEVTKSVVQALGEKPFHLRGPLSGAALDSVMSVLIEHHKEVNYGELKIRYSGLRKDTDFVEYTKVYTTNTKTLRDRIEKVKEYILG